MKTKTELSKPNRILWLDVARALAIISISLNHAVNRSYSYHDQMTEFFSIPLASSIFKAVIFVFSNLGVPLFMMISGALLLKKDIKDEQGVLKFYKHNLLSLFITSEIWYFLFYIIITALKGKYVFTFRHIVKEIILIVSNSLFVNQRSYNSTWYLPMVLGVYLLVPFIVMLKDKISRKTSLIFLIPLFYVSFVIPSFAEVGKVAADFDFHFGMATMDYPIICSLYVIYLIAGYWLSNGIMEKLSNFWIVAGTVVTFIGTCAFQLLSYARVKELHVGYQSIGILCCSVFLFELIRRGGSKLTFAKRPITYIARISFGIYFVHIAIMQATVKYMELHQIAMAEPVKLIFLEAISIIGSIIIIAPLSKIPFFRKYVFMIK